MRRVRMMALVGLALVAAGCASSRSRNELARLQSQVGLLDERVAQLERSSLGGLPGAGGSSFTELPAEPSPAAEAATPSKSGGAGGGAVTASLKPTTREIQQALKNAGFYQGGADGKMGPVTREAVKEFQRVHGLTDDGVVGKQTWAKLKAYADLSGADGEAIAAEVLK